MTILNNHKQKIETFPLLLFIASLASCCPTPGHWTSSPSFAQIISITAKTIIGVSADKSIKNTRLWDNVSFVSDAMVP